MVDISAHVSNNILERKVVSPDLLLLDNQNPRFFGEKIDEELLENHEIHDPRLQEYLRQVIYNKYSVQDLVSSISEVGFLKLDPVIVVSENNKFRVVEGNRRVAAIKTILGDIRRKVLSVSKSVEESLKEIEVTQLVNDCDDSTIWMLQGIRHVSGIRDWGPFQQAELIKTLQVHRGFTFKQIGSIIGLSPQRVSTILKGYYGVTQMMENPDWSSKATPDLFSHFEQAYVRGPIREWLSWNKDSCKYTDTGNLTKFYTWITEANPKVPREKLCSRDIRDKMSIVLENPQAKKLFTQEKVNIDEAFSIATTGKSFSKKLNSLSESFAKTLSTIDNKEALSEEELKFLQKINDELNRIFAQ
ncbi:ParB/RepB/Spo0J family partition protein [Oceanidesulfovibrio indonesiensis]|uniref:ParB/RepB/Spo0J family partition protein n=1 Tax=Oceanidesulfovibrio indonesiensis TaxID=54767 RepID=UPI00142FBF27|nr:ParB N-terminal domain-containing protein [Oceanidesulfovibrio indonesiensis]